jgi:hypothetical protein
MKSFLLILSLLCVSSCDYFLPSFEDEQSEKIQYWPKGTLLVSGFLNYSPDSVFHHNQVFIGKLNYFKNKKDVYIPDNVQLPQVWWPLNNAQAMNFLNQFQYFYDHVDDAEVYITDPTGRRIKLTYEEYSVYGDVNNEITYLGDQEYTLDIYLGNDEHYQAKTTLLKAPELEKIPGTIYTDVDIYKSEGLVFEYPKVENALSREIYNLPSDTNLIFYQLVHTDKDYIFMRQACEPDPELFFYGSSGIYFREGLYNRYITAGYFNSEYYQHLSDWRSKSTLPKFNSIEFYYTIYYLNRSLSNFFYSPFIWQLSHIDDLPEYRRSGDGIFTKTQQIKNLGNTDYIFEVSNIRRVRDDGNYYPANESNAIGVFGGASFRIENYTLIPERDYDIDTVAWDTYNCN